MMYYRETKSSNRTQIKTRKTVVYGLLQEEYLPIVKYGITIIHYPIQPILSEGEECRIQRSNCQTEHEV